MRPTYVVPFLAAFQLAGVLSMEAPNFDDQARELAEVYQQQFESDQPISTVGEDREAPLSEQVQNQTMFPEIAQEILARVGDLVAINDYMNSCKDYMRDYAHMFRNFARTHHHKLLAQATQCFVRGNLSFKGELQGRSFQEIAALICKAVLALPGNIDGRTLFSGLEENDLVTGNEETDFTLNFEDLFRAITRYHKFDSVQQYVRFCRKVSDGIHGLGEVHPVPNMHFPEKDAIKAALAFYSGKLCSAGSIDRAVDLAYFDDSDEDEKLQNFGKMIAVSERAKRKLVELLMGEKALKDVDEIPCTEKGHDYFEKFLTCVVKHEKTKKLAALAATTIYEIVRGYDKKLPIELCQFVVLHLLRNKLPGDEALLVFKVLLKSGYYINNIISDFKEARANSQ